MTNREQSPHRNLNKVVYVEAKPAPLWQDKMVKIPTGEKTTGLFGQEKDVKRKEVQWEQTGWSDSEIDGVQLSDDIAQAVQKLNADGYEVITVSPLTSGRYSFKFREQYGSGKAVTGGGYGYGYGFSYTIGVTIVARKIAAR